MCETLELDKVNTVYQVDSYLAEATMKEVKLTPIEEKLNLLKPPKVESNYIKYLFQLQTKPNGGIYEFEIEVQKKLNSLDTQLEFPVIGMISRITSTVKILEGLSDINSISEMDSVTLHNNQRINSYELTSYSMISHSEIVRKNTEEMKTIFNDSRDLADGINNEIDFKNKISDKLRIFDRDFMGPYTSTAIMFMVMSWLIKCLWC